MASERERNLGLQQHGEAEIGELDLALAVHEDVVALDVCGKEPRQSVPRWICWLLCR